MGAIYLGLGLCLLLVVAGAIAVLCETDEAQLGDDLAFTAVEAERFRVLANKEALGTIEPAELVELETWTILRRRHPEKKWVLPKVDASTPANPTASDMRVCLDFLNSQHRIECSWCKEVLQFGREPVSHGICDQCSKVHFGIDLAAVRKQEGVR